MTEPLKLVADVPDAEVIAALEGLLAEARAGTIRGICILTSEPKIRQTGTTQAGIWDARDAVWAAETFKHRWLHEWQNGLRR